jgi:DNA-binding NtrC family response regulator
VGEERFREDLLYRLNVFEIPVSPLRVRREDIVPIARHLLERVGMRLNRPGMTLAPEAERLLEAQRWPGNVRELSNILERAVILAESGEITVADFPGLARIDPPEEVLDLKQARSRFERQHVLAVIKVHGGDKRAAAKALGIDLSSLYRKLQEA